MSEKEFTIKTNAHNLALIWHYIASLERELVEILGTDLIEAALIKAGREGLDGASPEPRPSVEDIPF